MKGVFVRVPEKERAFLSDFVRGHPSLNKSQVVTKLLQLLQRQKAEHRLQFLGAEGTVNPLQIFGAALEQKSWAEHAFSFERWEWALEAYRELESLVTETYDLWLHTQYKQGYCWNEVAISIRNLALEKDREGEWFELYGDAIYAVRVGIQYNDRSGQDGFYNPVVLFNNACAWSHLAQFLVERQVGPDRWWTKEIHDAEPESVLSKYTGTKAPGIKVWRDKVGARWRDRLKSRNPRHLYEALIKEVTRCGKQSMSALEGLSSIPRYRDQRDHDNERRYWIDRTQFDPDLVFLRTDSKFKKEYETWFSENEEKNSYRRIFRSLKKALPEEIKEAVEDQNI